MSDEEKGRGENEGGGQAAAEPERVPLFRPGKRTWLVVLLGAAALLAYMVFFRGGAATEARPKKARGQAAWQQRVEVGGAGSSVMTLVSLPGGGLITGTSDGKLVKFGGGLDSAEWKTEAGGSVQVAAARGGLLALGDNGGAVRLLSAERGAKVRELGRFDDGPALALDISEDGRLVLAGGMDGTCDVYEAAGGRKVSSFSLVGGARLARFLDVETALTVSYPGRIERWAVATGQRVGEPLEIQLATVESAALSGDGRTLAVGDREGQVVLIDVAGGRPMSRLTELDGVINGLAFSRDGRALALCDDSKVGLLDLGTQQTRSVPLGAGHHCTDVAFAEGTSGVYVGQEDGRVYLYNLQ